MPYPDKPNIQTSYTAYEQSLGDGSLPGQELDNDFANLADSVESLNDFVRGVTRSDGALRNGIVTRDSLSTAVLVDLGLNPPSGAVYSTRAEFVAANALNPGLTRPDGYVLTAAGLDYRRLAGSTAIPDVPGWVPNGPSSPQHFGATGGGTTDDRAALSAMNTWGGDAYIPKPPVAYNVSSPINLDRVGITVDPTASWEALTDSGNITWNTNLFTQQDPPVPVHRFNGRVFFGDAAHEMAGGWVAGSGTTADRGAASWYADDAPVFGGYVFRDATLAVANGQGTVGLAVSVRSSDRWNASWNAPIGWASFVNNDRDGSNIWGGIIEGRAQHANGLTFGIEVALGNNSGVTRQSLPYAIFGATGGGGVIGLWFAGGGDASFGTPSNAPNNSPMVVLKNQTNTGLTGGWATGIVFAKDAIVGTDGSAGSSTFAPAISMGRNQRIEWHEPTNQGLGFSITSRVGSLAESWRLEAANLSLDLRRPDGTFFAQMRDGGVGGVDYPVLQNGSGTASYRAEGASTNIDLFFVPKGTGRVRFGTRTASSDVPVTGYIEILDSAGNVRRLAVVG